MNSSLRDDLASRGLPLHIWKIETAARPSPQREQVLSNDERERIARLQAWAPRHRFLVARVALREILGAYVGCEPGALQFRYGGFGKPRLGEPAAARELAFSVAYTQNVALVALGWRAAIGVDVEAISGWQDASPDGTRGLRLSRRELLWLAARSVAEQVRYRARLWVGREAWLKAAGHGFATPVEPIEMVLPEMQTEPGMGASLRIGRKPLTGWCVAEPSVGSGLVAAVVADGPACVVEAYDFQSTSVEQEHAAIAYGSAKRPPGQHVGQIVQAKHHA